MPFFDQTKQKNAGNQQHQTVQAKGGGFFGQGKQSSFFGASAQPTVQRKKSAEEGVMDRVRGFDEYSQEASDKYGIPIEQIRSIIAVESAGKPNATSGAAFGLMQVTKGTWEDTCTHPNYPELKKYAPLSNIYDPRINVLVGTATFKLKMKTVGVESDNENFASLAITAYNAGEGTVRKAMQYARDGGSKDPASDCLKPEYLKKAIEATRIYSYYLTGGGKSRNKSGTKKEAIDLKYQEVSKYPEKVRKYLAVQEGGGQTTTPDGGGGSTSTGNGGSGGTSYTVKSGESPSMIANRPEFKQFGLSAQDIINANLDQIKGSGSNKYFYVGANIRIPVPSNSNSGNGGGTPPTTGGQPIDYTVKKGESPTMIVNRPEFKALNISVNDLINANLDQIKGSPPNQYFWVGANIKVPSPQSSTPAPSQEEQSAPPVSTPTNVQYVVKKGESPTMIANRPEFKKLGVTVDQILAANATQLHGKAPNQYFWVGANIVIPGGGSSPSPAPTPVPEQQQDQPGSGPIAGNSNEIKGSVGQGGKNDEGDAIIVQTLLKKAGLQIVVDGDVGPKTITAIRAYQKKAFGWDDGKVDPGGKTFGSLVAGQVKVTPDDIVAWEEPEGDMSASTRPTYENITKVYGSVHSVQTVMMNFPFPMKLYGGSTTVSRATVHKKVAKSLESALKGVQSHYGMQEIERLGINNYDGLYNKRKMRGSSKWSTHAWAVAIDLDASRNQLRWGADKAQFAKKEYKPLLDIMESHGWYNLGRYKNYDYMHFQAVKP